MAEAGFKPMFDLNAEVHTHNTIEHCLGGLGRWDMTLTLGPGSFLR